MDAPQGYYTDLALGYTSLLSPQACALRHDGVVHCWGGNDSGERDVPQIDALVSGLPDSMCAQLLSGRLYCWGQPGPAVSVPPLEVDQASLSADGLGCGVLPDGKLRCWGDLPSPLSLPTGPFVKVATASGSGTKSACAIRDDQTIECTDLLGGDAGLSPPTGAFVDIEGGDGYCAVSATGEVSCWGGTLAPPGGGGTTYVSVSVGTDHACALDDVGQLTCFGDDTYGQLQAPDPATFSFIRVEAGWYETCAIGVTTGDMTCWGIRTGVPGVTVSPSVGTLVDMALPASAYCALRDDRQTLLCGGFPLPAELEPQF